VSHGHELGQPRPPALLARYPDADVIVFGHTHRALVERAGPRLVVNPGAAGPRRFHLAPSVARLRLRAGSADVETCRSERLRATGRGIGGFRLQRLRAVWP
jgi:predicted phosphodiesterase